MNAIERKVLQFIGENPDAPDVFGDITPIRDSVNDAIEEIALLTGLYKEQYRIPLYEGQSIYLVNFSRGLFGYVVDAWIRNDNRALSMTDLQQLKMRDPRWLHSAGVPFEFYHVGLDYIGVNPAPSGTGSVLELTCCVIPERYSEDGDRIKLREDFVKATVHYAVADYYASRGDAKTSTEHMVTFYDLLGLNINYRQSDEATFQSGYKRPSE